MRLEEQSRTRLRKALGRLDFTSKYNGKLLRGVQ